MGQVRAPHPVKLLVPMLARDEALLARAAERLAERFGPTDYASPLLPFGYTRYYEAEMGPQLLRQFVAYERLISPEELPAIKLATNALEQEWADGDGRRRINLDPGYLTPAKLVLASTKDYAHRVYLGQGIYAEVTLAFRGGDFAPWPWTYPDYQSEPYLVELRAIRRLYMAQLRASAATRR